MITDETAEMLAQDLVAFREIAHAALDVIAEQQRKIDLLVRTNLRLREELRERMGVGK